MEWIVRKDFFTICRLLVYSGDCFFFSVQTFKFDTIPFVILLLCPGLMKPNSESPSLCLHLEVFSNFSSSSFKVASVKLRFLIHFELIFWGWWWEGSSLDLLNVEIYFPQHPLLKRLFFQHVLAPLLDQVAIVVWVYFWVFCFIPFLCVSVFVSVPCYFS